jgi:hypothetical protein
MRTCCRFPDESGDQKVSGKREKAIIVRSLDGVRHGSDRDARFVARWRFGDGFLLPVSKTVWL